jgi:FkbM family methyltransferase
MIKSINSNVLGLCAVDGFCPWEMFNLNEDSVVVDLGAFVGDFSKYIYETYNCRVDAYEPLNHGCQNISHPKFKLIKTPVFDGSKVWFDRDKSDSSAHIFHQSGERVDTIDIREITKEHIDLLKVNIEGAEIVVMNLADLNNVDQILIEFHFFRACEEDREIVYNEITNVVSRIIGFGYKMIQIDSTSPAYFFYGKT